MNNQYRTEPYPYAYASVRDRTWPYSSVLDRNLPYLTVLFRTWRFLTVLVRTLLYIVWTVNFSIKYRQDIGIDLISSINLEILRVWKYFLFIYKTLSWVCSSCLESLRKCGNEKTIKIKHKATKLRGQFG